jgi:hypothetical protein
MPGRRRQEQDDPTDATLRLVRTAVQARPEPPRVVDTVGLVRASYHGKLLPLLLLDGVGIALFAITFFQSGSAIAGWSLRIFFGGGVLLFLLAPLQAALVIRRRTRDGLLAQAAVTNVRVGGDRQGHREARGTRFVHHPMLGDFHDQFAIVAPWAESISRDSTLDVLVDPTEARTWLTLGLHKPDMSSRR